MTQIHELSLPATKQAQKRRRKGSYGLDAPSLLPVLAVLVAANIASGILSRTVWPFLGAAAIFALAGLGLYASLRGKFVVWSELLDGLELQGDEQVLDIGCGRGAVLLMAAERLTTGRAVGVDLWKRGDQSGNAIEATQRNAVAEGVADRVELRTADMTALPFKDDHFDLVLSSMAIHNSRGTKRDTAIEEAIRVTRPGGRILVADIMTTSRYAKQFAKLGMKDISKRRLSWRMWWSGPWANTTLVSCTKPPA